MKIFFAISAAQFHRLCCMCNCVPIEIVESPAGVLMIVMMMLFDEDDL